MKRAFFLSAILTLCASAFCADSGGVSTGTQTFGGRKNWLMFSPVLTTASGTITLNKNSGSVQVIDANGAGRTVKLPPESSSQGWVLRIVNSTAGAYALTVKDSANVSTIATVSQYQTADFYCDGVLWTGAVYSSATTGFILASGATVGASSQTQIFTNGVTADTIIGNTAAPLTVTAKAGSSAIGNALTLAGGAGNGAFNGGAASVTGGASGAGATGAGGAFTGTGGAAASTNGAGGASGLTGGAGAGTGAGGAIPLAAGASGAGATGNGGAITGTAGAASSTNGAGGAITWTTGAGAGTGVGGVFTISLGASGASAGATAPAISGTAGTGLNGQSGGAVNWTGGAGQGAGNGGNIVLTPGAAGGSGAIGRVSLAGPVSSPVTTAQTLTNGQTITLPTTGRTKLLGNAGAITGVLMTAGRFDGEEIELINPTANSFTFAAVGTSLVADGVSAVIAANTRMRLVYDSTSAKWYHGN